MYFTLPYLGGQISCGVAFTRHGLGQLECVLCVCAFRFFNTSTPAFHTEFFVQKQTRWDYLTDAILLSRTFLIQFFRDKFITHWHTCNCLAYFNFLLLRKFMQNHAIKNKMFYFQLPCKMPNFSGVPRFHKKKNCL